MPGRTMRPLLGVARLGNGAGPAGIPSGTAGCAASGPVRFVDPLERDDRGVDEPLAGILEVHGHALADHGLHLPEPPAGSAG